MQMHSAKGTCVLVAGYADDKIIPCRKRNVVNHHYEMPQFMTLSTELPKPKPFHYQSQKQKGKHNSYLLDLLNPEMHSSRNSKVRCGSLAARVLLIETINRVLLAGMHRPDVSSNWPSIFKLKVQVKAQRRLQAADLQQRIRNAFNKKRCFLQCFPWKTLLPK